MTNDEHKMVEERMDADTYRLYGNLKDAADYLLEVAEQHPDAQLDEYWTGYEEMYMTFVWMRFETDEEVASRKQQEAEAAMRAKKAYGDETARRAKWGDRG